MYLQHFATQADAFTVNGNEVVHDGVDTDALLGDIYQTEVFHTDGLRGGSGESVFFVSNTPTGMYIYLTTQEDGAAFTTPIQIAPSDPLRLSGGGTPRITQIYDIAYSPTGNMFFGFLMSTSSWPTLLYQNEANITDGAWNRSNLSALFPNCLDQDAPYVLAASEASDLIVAACTNADNGTSIYIATSTYTDRFAGASAQEIYVHDLADWNKGVRYLDVELSGDAGEETIHVLYMTKDNTNGVQLGYTSSTPTALDFTTTTITGVVIDGATGFGLAEIADLEVNDNGDAGVMFGYISDIALGPTIAYSINYQYIYEAGKNWATSSFAQTSFTGSVAPPNGYQARGLDFEYIDGQYPALLRIGDTGTDLVLTVNTSTLHDLWLFDDVEPAEASGFSWYHVTSTGELGAVFIGEDGIVYRVTSTLSASLPVAPTSITSTAHTTSSITLDWTDVASNETAYRVDYTTSTFPHSEFGVATDSTSTDLTGLVPNTGYYARVAARNDLGLSAYATSSLIYTNPNVPGTPVVSNVTTTGLTLTWTSGDNASGTVYSVYNATDAETVATTTATTLAVSSLEPETSYQFRVLAIAASGSGNANSAYSATSTATTTLALAEEDDEEEESPGGGGGGGGGGFFVSPSAPKAQSGVAALRINSGDATTDSVDVTLTFNVSNANEMAISLVNEFGGVPYVPFTSTASYTLSAGNGIKWVYVKLRSSEGGTLIVSDSIELVSQGFDAPPEVANNNGSSGSGSCPLPLESAAKSGASNAVYYITLDCTKRAFANAATYFTYFTSWDDVLVTTQSTLDSIPNDTLGFMPWGPLYNPASGSLVKTPSDPKTYLLLDGTLYHIANEAAAEYQFGPAWATWIEDVDAKLLTNYPISSQILGTSTRPNGILIKYANNPKVYQLAEENSTQVKRWIVDTATFNALNFRDDRIVTIPETESYPDGTNLGTSVLTSTPPNYVFTTLLQMGDRGLEVIYLQDRLKTLGYFPIEVVSNGVYGPTTDISVRALQTERGLNVNGTTDAPTRAVLNS